MARPAPRLSLWALAAALVLAAAPRGAAGQQLTPFQGRNAPLNGTTDVYVSAVVDHLVNVDDAMYRFEVRACLVGGRVGVAAAAPVGAAAPALTLAHTGVHSR